jgi:polysaccharide export outer membrane protein
MMPNAAMPASGAGMPAAIQSGAGAPSPTIYSTQNGPTAPLYAAPLPATPQPQSMYGVQADPGGAQAGYYPMQVGPLDAPAMAPPAPLYAAPQAPAYPPQYAPPPQYAQPGPQYAPPQYAQPAPQYPQQPQPYAPQPAAQPQPATPYGIPARIANAAPMAQHPGEGGYTLGPGDKVKITVFDEPDMTGEYPVDGNGAIRLPLIGSLRASGATAAQLEANIRAALSPAYIKNPRVNVDISLYRPIYVVGAVLKPGQYPYVNDMTMLNAVALAGGFNDQAVESAVYVRHEGQTQEEKVSTAQPLLIRPGDTVRVDTTLFWDVLNVFSPLTGPTAVTAAMVQ